MGKPIDPCFVPNNPYQSFAPTANVTTTPPPPPPYYVLPQSGVQCVNPPCVCGSVFLPMGPCVNILIASGNNSLSYNLQHPVDVLLEQEQILITTTPLIVAGGNFYANNLNISFNSFCTTTTTTTTASPVMGNFANYNNIAIWNGSSKLTTVGTNGGPSAYGTYDQSGNVFEWNDLDGIVTDRRGYNGGYWALGASYMSNLSHLSIGVNGYGLGFEVRGFRIASLNNPLQLLNFVSVGNAGNIAEIYTFIDSNSNISKSYGAVDYNYKIGALLVTNDDYVVFLNAAAKSDPYGLYDSRMPITKSGNNGSYTYLVQDNYNKKPVVYVSWFDCARYCNWLHNNRGDGSTETGAYAIPSDQTNVIAPAKSVGANYYIPTENEWHKAAYYSPNYGGAGVGGYWTYATQSDTAPIPVCATPTGDGTPCGAITTTLPPTPPVGTLQNTIQIVVKLKDSKQIIGYQVLGSTNSSTDISNINIPFIDTVDLNNQILQIEFYSLCARGTSCCDHLPSTISISPSISTISCETTTTTTTTLIPFCSSLNLTLADSFTGPVAGVGVFAGQVNYNSVWNRVENVWTTTGFWPCGIPYEFSITCDPITRTLIFDGNIPCARGLKTVKPSSATALVPFIVTYPDLNSCSTACCYAGCDNCDHSTTCGGGVIDLVPTTFPPWCSQFLLPDVFNCTIVGHGALAGQQKVSTVTRINNVWSTSGVFPCGADYNMSMTCNSASQNFTYNGSMSCCTGRKNIADPSTTPYLKPNFTAPPIIWYADCSNCSPACDTSTSTTPPPPTIDCSSTDPLVIKGYAFYNSAAGSQNIPGIGSLQAPCFGGHNCNNISFVPQLINGGQLGWLDANKSVSLNNKFDINNPNRSDTFQFDIRRADLILNKIYNTKLNLKCGTYIDRHDIYSTKSACHDIATWVVLTTEIDGETVLLFNDCIFTDTPVDLNYECVKCCSWDGVGSLDLTVNGCTIQESLQFLQLSDNLWEVNQLLSCGDTFQGIVICDPNIPYTGENSCYTKWTFQSFSLPCATNLRLTGAILIPCECTKPPVWEFAADSLMDCICCGPQKIGYTDDTVGTAPINSEWYFVETLEDLQKCKVLITGTSQCDSLTLNNALTANLYEWINNGGIYLYQDEHEECGIASLANDAMTVAHSSLTSAGGLYSQPNDGYNATSSNLPCVSGLSFSGALSAKINGGIPLLYAPEAQHPAAINMAGEYVGSGSVILMGDRNVVTNSTSAWTVFLKRLLTIPSNQLFDPNFHVNPTTTTLPPLSGSGACYNVYPECYQTSQEECEYYGGTFSGSGTYCPTPSTTTTLPPSGILVEFNYNFHPKIDVLIY